MQTTLTRSSRLIPILGLTLAACSSGGGGGGAPPGGAATGRIAGRAVVEGAGASLLAASAALRRTDDDDALRARDLGDLTALTPARADGRLDDRNRADWLRAAMTAAGTGQVRVVADTDVALTVFRLRQGHAPHEAVYTGRGKNLEAQVAVEAGDHLLLAVQGEVGTYAFQLASSDQPAPLTVLAAPAQAAAAATLAEALPEAVPGDVIVRGVDDAAVIAVQRLGFEVLARHDDVVRLRSVLGTALRADATGRAALADALFKVRRALPHAQWVEPNFVARSTRQPNDEFVNLQWAIQATNLTQAWDTTVGEPVVIAVVDTGILKNHPDLRANVLADGFDFVSEPSNGDGDGIDADPEDILVSGNVFHGSHCAGIAAAVTDNGIGIAGVNWNARILPLRALAPGGGSLFDIAQAIRYAVGLSNVSGRTPSQPARVINLSLGAPSDSRLMREAVAAAAQAGAILVVAAGNSALQGNPVEFPAAYDEVITVGAVGPSGNRAPYSGFRDYVDVAAPGGDVSQGPQDGILSTVAIEQNGRFVHEFAFLQGTSMAAPFVAGAVSLMLSVNPALTFANVMAILAQTSRDRGAPGRDAEFGFGLIDVAAAVAAARTGGGGGGEARLRLDRAEVEFAPDRRTQAIAITSSVAGREIAGLAAEFVGQGPDGVSGQFSSTTTPATLTLEITPQLAAQPQAFTIAIVSTVTQERLEVRARIVAGNGGAAGTLIVELLDANGQVVKTVEAVGGAFAFEALAPGSYLVRAGIDVDRNGRITDLGDFSSDDLPVALAAGGNSDAGTLRARLNDPARTTGGLTGEFSFSEFRNPSTFLTTYTFRSEGIVDRRQSFSTGGRLVEFNRRGTFSVRGDTVTIQVEGETLTATIERDGGVIQSLRIGNDRYTR